METEEKRMKYIDADKIKAEIDKITESLTKSCNPDPLGTTEECMVAAELEALGLVKSAIDQMKETEPKLQKLKKLADGMYRAAQYLTTDASHLRKAMEEYHQFIIQNKI